MSTESKDRVNAYSIERELRAGEALLWKGKPATGIRFQSSDMVSIPFSILWGGFAIVWECSVLSIWHKQMNAAYVSVIFPIFGLPFVMAGLYFMIGRFFVDAKTRAHTEYAVTSERAIISSGLFSRKVKSLNLKSIQEISFSEKMDGSGTITFGPSSPFFNGMGRYNSFPGMPNNAIPSFMMIPNVRTVYELLGKTQRGEA